MGPVGTVETESSVQGSGLSRLQSMNQDRQEALVRFGPSLWSLAISMLVSWVLSAADFFQPNSRFSFIYGCQTRKNLQIICFGIEYWTIAGIVVTLLIRM